MNEKLYKFLVNSCNKPTIVVDISGVILFYNKSAQNLFNIQEDYTLLFDLLNEDSIKYLRDAISYVREKDEEGETELKLDDVNYKLKILKFEDIDYQEVYLCTFEKIKKSLYNIKTSLDNKLSLNQFLKYLLEYSSDFIFIIDSLGFKGFRIGDAMVSHEHANIIVNLGRARSRDVLNIIDIVKTKVKEVYGIDLEPEIIFW